MLESLSEKTYIAWKSHFRLNINYTEMFHSFPVLRFDMQPIYLEHNLLHHVLGD